MREVATAGSEHHRDDGGEGPPLFRGWLGCYAFVVLHLILWILLLYWFTRWFSGRG
ncbi:hypothetical protein HRbin11_02307 [bacterium HR11]|nr:hypothetical protein HRbin11_02307 [bacterium HR11]